MTRLTLAAVEDLAFAALQRAGASEQQARPVGKSAASGRAPSPPRQTGAATIQDQTDSSASDVIRVEIYFAD